MFLPMSRRTQAPASTATAGRAADWLAIGLGFALQPLMQAQLGDGLDLLGVGVVGGTLAFLVGRLSEGRG